MFPPIHSCERTWAGRRIWSRSTQGHCLEVQHGLGTRPLASPWSASSCFPAAFALEKWPRFMLCRELTSWFPLECGFLSVSALKQQFRRTSWLRFKHLFLYLWTVAAHVYERLGRRSGEEPLDAGVSCAKGKLHARRERWAWSTHKPYMYGNITVKSINQHH